MTDDRTSASRPADRQHSQPEAAAVPSGVSSQISQRPPLTPAEIRRLTLYKWRYSLESSGFSADQVGRLLFLKWMVANSGIRG